MWWESMVARSAPKVSKTAVSFAGSLMEKLRLPLQSSRGSVSKPRPKALRKSLGSLAAKSGLAVIMRISRAEKVLQ